MYKCNKCDGELRYDIESKLLACSHCGNKISLTAYSLSYKPAEEALSVFACPNCGGEVYTNDSRMADFCSYCGAPVMLERRSEKREMPKKIVPFEVTCKECEEQYIKYVEKMPFVPKEYREGKDKLDFRGIYVPFYQYHVDISGTAKYSATKETAMKNQIHKVEEYEMEASVTGKTKNVIHDASRIFSDAVSEAIIFGDTTGVTFHPAYLSGFYADFKDVPEETYREYAKEKVAKHIEEQLDQAIAAQKGKRFTIWRKKSDLKLEAACDADLLRPVWFMARETGRGKDKRVAYAVVNGSTKDIVADLPFDEKKLMKNSLITSLILFVLFQLSFTLTPGEMLGFSAYCNFFTVMVYFFNIRSIYRHEIVDEYKNKKRKRVSWKRIGLRILATLLLLFLMLFLPRSVNCLILLIAEACFALGYRKKWQAISAHGTHTTRWIFAIYAASLLLIGMASWNPVQDMWYFLGGGISLITSILTMFATIRDYNLLCSQPLPQFSAYKGGHQNEGLER